METQARPVAGMFKKFLVRSGQVLLLTVIGFVSMALAALIVPQPDVVATRRTTILAALLCYAVLPSIALILPNPLMPVAVRIPHLIEISASMAIFGLLAGVVMTYPLREKTPGEDAERTSPHTQIAI